MTGAFQDHQIRQYLLGDLPEREESEIEIAFLGDPDLLERIELARHDLMDDYAAARLSAADREKFERHVLSTHAGREQVEIANLLRKAAAERELPRSPVWYSDIRWLSLAALVTLAVGAFLAWRLASDAGTVGEGAAVTRAARVEPPAQTPSVPSSGPSGGASRARSAEAPTLRLATLVLTANLDRSRGVPPTLLTTSGATHVDLIPPTNDVGIAGPPARIETVEGAVVWSGPAMLPEAAAADPRPRVRVPVSALPPGDYLLFISPKRSKGSAGESRYYFRVRER